MAKSNKRKQEQLKKFKNMVVREKGNGRNYKSQIYMKKVNQLKRELGAK